MAFNGSNGKYSYATPTVDAAGNLYGTAYSGGASGYGTVFEIAAGSHTLSILATFNGINGENPWGNLTADAAGNLYGTTSKGGAGYHGTVFEISAGSHTLSTLVAFNNTNGADPLAGLVADANGNLYGTTMQGGANGDGTVFEISADSHTLSTLATFNGTNPSFAQ